MNTASVFLIIMFYNIFSLLSPYCSSANFIKDLHDFHITYNLFIYMYGSFTN